MAEFLAKPSLPTTEASRADAEIKRLVDGADTGFLFEKPGKYGMNGAKPGEKGDNGAGG
ncbi:MAG: hypothetical protein ACLR5G_08145 [Eubacteriales bacterium]